MLRVKKNVGVATLVAVIAGLLLVGCGGSDSATPATEGTTGDATSALPPGTYKIGFVESITGRLAFYDPNFASGLKVRIDQINAEGGVDGKLKLELIERDGKSDPAQGSVVARELTSEGVDFAVTPCDADIGIPGALIFQSNKTPVVMACGSGWTFPEVVGDYAFNNVFGTAAMGAGQAQFAIDRGWKRACDLSSNDYFYGKNTSDVFEATYKQLGGKIACHVYYKLTDTDFRAVATQIARSKPDVVTTTLVLPGSTTFLKQVRAAGYKGPFIWSDSADSRALLGAGTALNNVYFTTHACPTDESTAAFFEAFKAKTGKAPDAQFVATGGDLADLIEAALLKAGSTDGTKVRDAFAALKDVKATSGTISYADAPLFHNPVKDIFVLKWDAAKKEPTCVTNFYPKVVPKIK